MRCLACLPAILLPAAVHAAEPVTGRWITKNEKAVVEVDRCGAAMCGRIVRLLPRSDAGKTVDERNKDAALRTRPLVGLPILLDFRESAREWHGKLYDPQSGNIYTATLARYPDGALKVRGCFFFICRTEKWLTAR